MTDKSKELLAFMTNASQCTLVRFQCAVCHMTHGAEINPATNSPLELSRMITEAAVVAMDSGGWRYVQGVGNVCRHCVTRNEKVAARVAENDMGVS